MKNILFLCTGNSARSLIAEGILRHRGKGRYAAFSAGSQPTGKPNPAAIAILAKQGIDTSFARSKSWDDFAEPADQEMHIIITVCSSAAGEVCPIWPGRPTTAHWGVDDPAAITEPADLVAKAFGKTFDEMSRRIDAFLELDETNNKRKWHSDIASIGAIDKE